MEQNLNLKNVNQTSITLMDVDSVILSYIQNVIKPTIVENAVTSKVPVYYASPERWKSIQLDGFMRDDKNGSIILPAIAFKSISITNTDVVPSSDIFRGPSRIIKKKIQGSKVPISATIEDIRNPKKNTVFYTAYVPNYVSISYETLIWGGKVTHINSIVENFITHENRYWYGTNGLRFLTSYDNISQNIEVNSGDNRYVKTSFNMNVNAYLIPETVFDQKSIGQVQTVKIQIQER